MVVCLYVFFFVFFWVSEFLRLVIVLLVLLFEIGVVLLEFVFWIGVFEVSFLVVGLEICGGMKIFIVGFGSFLSDFGEIVLE